VSSRAWVAFAAVSVLWGIPYLFIKVAVDDGVPPGFVAWSRVTLAAVVLLALAWRAGVLGGMRTRWRWLGLYALLEIAIPFPLIAAGERHVSSSLAAIMIATVPLLVALLALRFDAAERVAGRRLVGLLVGFAGVVALVGVDLAGDAGELLGAGAVGLAAVGYAAGPMILKRHMADLDPRATMGVSLGLAALLLAPLAVAAPPSSASLTGDAVLALVVLGLLCTAAAFVVMAILVAEVGPGRALVITCAGPLRGIFVGMRRKVR
jgi:drug/metabolite transporter (DMT)-like permease